MTKCKLETTSFGHGISTTLLNLAKGYSIINGGYNVNPRLVNEGNDTFKINKDLILQKDVSGKVIRALRKLLRMKKALWTANVQGYEVAGKTGTAEQVIDGQYSKVKINTFASIFPSSNPKYVLIVMLNSPKGSSNYVYNYETRKENIVLHLIQLDGHQLKSLVKL